MEQGHTSTTPKRKSKTMARFLGVFKRPGRFSVEHVRLLRARIAEAAAMENTMKGSVTENPQRKGTLIESVRDLSEVLVYGDQHGESFFEVFLEQQMLQLLLGLLNMRDRDITVQLVQTLSILVENLKDTSFLYYILSNNYINNLICSGLDDAPESALSTAPVVSHSDSIRESDLLAYYVSFLKTLSLRLDPHSVNFFFNEREGTFPLFCEAVKLFNHRDTMVRVSVRVLTLNVFKVDSPSLRKWLIERGTPSYFFELCSLFRRLCARLGELVLSSKHSDHRRIDDCLAEISDMLSYMQDVFDVGVLDLSIILARNFIHLFALPLLFGSLIPDSRLPESERIPPRAALFLIANVFHVVKHAPVVNMLTELMFSHDPLSTLHDLQPDLFPLQSATASRFPSILLRYLSGEDSLALAASSVLYALFSNPAVDPELLDHCHFYPLPLAQKKASPAPETKSPNKEQQPSGEPKTQQPTVAAESSPSLDPLGISMVKSVSSSIIITTSHYDSSPTTSTLLLGSIGDSAAVYEWQKDFRSLLRNPPPPASSGALTGLASSGNDKGKKPDEILNLFPDESSTDLSEVSESSELSEVVKDKKTKENEDDEGEDLKESSTPQPGDVNATDTKEENPVDKDSNDPVSQRIIERVLDLTSNSDTLRPITVQMAFMLVSKVIECQKSGLSQEQNDRFMAAYNRAIENTRFCFGSSLADIFLELFEQTGSSLREIVFDNLIIDGTIVLPVTTSPVSNIKLVQRLPSGEAERVQKAVHILFIFRRFYHNEIVKQKDTLLPLAAMPLPKCAKSSYYKFKAGTDYGYFICPVSSKKSVLRYFAIEEGALLILDPPPNVVPQVSSSSLSMSLSTAFSPKKSAQSPQASPAPVHKHPTTAIVSEIIPLESVEIEMETSNIQLVSHPNRWSMKMEFVSKKKMLDAVHMIESGRRGARQFKMKQIFKALGIDADDMPIATPTHCQTFHDEISETCSSASATPRLSFSTPATDISCGTPAPPLSSTPLLADSKHGRESSQDELVKDSEALFASTPQLSSDDLSSSDNAAGDPVVKTSPLSSEGVPDTSTGDPAVKTSDSDTPDQTSTSDS